MRVSWAGVLYGQPATVAGQPTACTELRQTASGRWICTGFVVNSDGLPVRQPAQYQGPCADLEADQASASWHCLGNVPLPDDQAPPITARS
jgi:hypothetical protein